ncbi:hypothetical protein QNM97_09680 [Gordonia sp. L191]|uniref:hypothetical protein n=1 Tax=Gordonia sp. L191 TaxID=2982699 RepID=UPI0024C04D93|nr:hypothetical protein [Gordonia sp. L191]WHU49211.1 hypothetical protein QNM97_09680 [Gordonia sp. L191]
MVDRDGKRDRADNQRNQVLADDDDDVLGLVRRRSSKINIALPYLMTNLHTDLDTAKWLITGFMLTMGTSAPLTAFLGERISYKRL